MQNHIQCRAQVQMVLVFLPWLRQLQRQQQQQQQRVVLVLGLTVQLLMLALNPISNKAPVTVLMGTTSHSRLAVALIHSRSPAVA
jgi:phosphopantetheinyl transferase